jgi:thiol-disulfide isomerase/thioredoxin
MTRKIAIALACACLVFCIPRNTSASVGVGEKPKLEFRSADGTPVSLEKLKGKIVVVDFWATWCGPCMAEAEHMVKINDQYGKQGLQMVGISLDANQGEMMQVAKQKGFAWPQYFDGKVWSNTIAQTWGVDSIPRTFLIGPQGDVLWTGHPGAIDQALADAFKNHPPQLVDPKMLADANAALDKVQ